MPSAYPAIADVMNLMESVGITLTAPQVRSASHSLAAAISAFETKAKRKMLASGEPQTYSYDPPTSESGVILFGRKEMATVSAVAYQPRGSESLTLDADTDYVLAPYDAPALGVPYTRITLFNRCWSTPLCQSTKGCIKITGLMGYGTTIPDDAWEAMRLLAGISILTAQGAAQSQGVLMTQIDSYKVDYGASLRGSGPYSFTITNWMDFAVAALAQYTKLV